jgi:SGNH domain (fused to AT3 domains)
MGVVARASRAAPSISAAIHEWEPHPNRTYPGDTPRAVLFWSDSLMQHLLPRVAQILDHPNGLRRTVVLQTRSGCVPILGIERFTLSCEDFTREAYQNALNMPELESVVIAASWAGFVEEKNYYRAGDPGRTRLDLESSANDWIWDGFEAEVRALITKGRRVVLILTSPNNPALPPGDMALRDGLSFRVQLPAPARRSRANASSHSTPSSTCRRSPHSANDRTSNSRRVSTRDCKNTRIGGPNSDGGVSRRREQQPFLSRCLRVATPDARVVVNPQTAQIVAVNPLSGAGAH